MGRWKSFEDLENNISLQELDLLINQKREEDKQRRYFEAAIQGIDMQKQENEATQRRLEEVKQRAAARLAGSEEEAEKQHYAARGFKVTTVKGAE